MPIFGEDVKILVYMYYVFEIVALVWIVANKWKLLLEICAIASEYDDLDLTMTIIFRILSIGIKILST